MKTIPLIRPDLPTLDEVSDQFREILENGRITNFSKYVTQFEEESGVYLNAHAITVSSGTMGLVFALHALGLQKGQKVILPSFTFMATAQAVLYAGGIPVFAEVDEDLTLSPADLAGLLEKHDDVGGVIGTHVYGMPCQVEELQELVDDYSRRKSRPVFLMYDAAHAFGSKLGGRAVGSFGDAEVFSLSVTKTLVSVEGGIVSSQNPEVVHRIRRMRNYGIESNYDAQWPGMNGKMSEFHAIVGLFNLRRLDELVGERQRKARRYYTQIQEHTNFENLPWPEQVIHTFKDFTVLMPAAKPHERENVMGFLKSQGVETRAYFSPPVHEQGMFKQYADRALPRTESLSRRVITLPFYASITDEEIDYVVHALSQC
jgi:dTDP-4-amino-4,6-dideoxygalactose transaminase